MQRPRASHSPQMRGPWLLQASLVWLLLRRVLRQVAKRQQTALPRRQKSSLPSRRQLPSQQQQRISQWTSQGQCLTGKIDSMVAVEIDLDSLCHHHSCASATVADSQKAASAGMLASDCLQSCKLPALGALLDPVSQTNMPRLVQ